MAPADDRPPPREPLLLLRALRSDMPAPDAAARDVARRLSLTLALNLASLEAIPSRVGPVGDENMPLPPRSTWMRRFLLLPRARMLGWVAAALAGAGTHAALSPEKVRVVYMDRPAPTESAATRVEPPAPEVGDQASLRTAGAETTIDPALAAPRPGATPNDSRWARERAMLDAARRKLAQGDSRACLHELNVHARAFPQGKLVQEREALSVNALVAEGEYEEARRRAERFLRQHPHSFLGPSVEAALQAIP